MTLSIRNLLIWCYGITKRYCGTLLEKLLIACFIFLLSLPSVASSKYASASKNDVGAVATVHPLATQAGLDALERGGNAIDAAVAAALTLGVVNGHNSGIGGGNFAVIHWADGTIQAIDGREMAPEAATRDMFIRNGKAIANLSTTGSLAIGVPGSLKVYDYMLKQGGKLSFAELILPAADLAEKGVKVNKTSARRLKRSAKTIAKFPVIAAILLDKNGEPLAAGDRLIQKDLAYTYRMLAKQGIDYFYTGDFAKITAQWMKENKGIVTYSDFSNYQMRFRDPIKSEYRGYTLYGFPPPSSGGIHVAQILNILEQFDVASLEEITRYHLLAEAMKLAFADRAYFLGDPDFVPVPKGLTDVTYAKQLAKKIDLNKAAGEVIHGDPPGADIDLFGKHTTHISAADKYGNWVAITTTVNTTFGSKVIIPGTGVVMNNQMDDFSIQPGVSNAFGLVGGEANSIEPGKRPLSSMSPTIVLKEGKPVMSLGAAGGPTIITQVVEALVNMIDLNMSAADSLSTQRIHHQWKPEILFVESDIPDKLNEGLKALGHVTRSRGNYGAAQIIKINQKGGFEAASEPRVIDRNK